MRDAYLLTKLAGVGFEDRSYRLEKGVPVALCTACDYEGGEKMLRRAVYAVVVVDRWRHLSLQERVKPVWRYRSYFRYIVPVDPPMRLSAAAGQGLQHMSARDVRRLRRRIT